MDEHGNTVMHAAIQSASLKIVELVLEFGWDFLSMENSDGLDPIDLCTNEMLSLGSQNTEANAIDKTERLAELSKVKSCLAKAVIRKNNEQHLKVFEFLFF